MDQVVPGRGVANPVPQRGSARYSRTVKGVDIAKAARSRFPDVRMNGCVCAPATGHIGVPW